MQVNKRKLMVGLVVIALVISVFVCVSLIPFFHREPPQTGNLIENGDFSAVTNSIPDGWTTGMWITSTGTSYLEAVTLEDGTTGVLIENAGRNDARFEQTVAVRENTTYRLSARVRAEGCEKDRIGANLSFLNIYGTSDCAYDTNGEWTTLTLYARTGSGQNEATVCVRVGGYGSEAMGKAWFTAVELTETDSVPVGAQVLDIAPSKEKDENTSSGKTVLTVLLVIALIALQCWFIFYSKGRVHLPDRRASGAAGKGKNNKSILNERMKQELLHPQDYKLHMTAHDWMIMLAITAVYAVIAFWGLGAASAPQKGYTSTAQGETVVFDLGARREDFHIYYYGGVSETQFSFSVSDDGSVYSDEYDAFFSQGECFKWLALRSAVYDANGKVTGATGAMTGLSGRYVRMTFKGAGAAIWETAMVDGDGKALPIVSVTASGGYEGRQDDPSTLIDEQDTVPEKPTYYNSMYFDEIYHARTGFEYANMMHAYENTHPPLGKVFMSWCISLMGMTPFAWRFSGALAGVLMLPALYVLAKQLFGKSRWAVLCTLLMAADCMHYTQTRIATIDSFPVLFMILMFFFMLRWTQMSFYHQSLGRTFVPLALSGIFMGLAVASKWIGCYGAIGLAVLFFARMFTLWRQSVYANAHRRKDKALARAADMFAKNAMLTLAACVVFFVIVPLLIYAASFIPYLRAYGPVRLNMTTLKRLWGAQVSMFRYHSGLVATHPFSSEWYEWPLIVKPMWYYNAAFKGEGMASSILSFGNPAVWWAGFAGIVFVLCCSLYRNALPSLGAVPAREDAYDRAMPLIAVGFLSVYLPWVLIPRLMFIYHYFASVPFIILATAQGLRCLERHKARIAHILTVLLCVVSILLFIGFYPLASGIEVPRAWCDMMNWFDNWMRY